MLIVNVPVLNHDLEKPMCDINSMELYVEILRTYIYDAIKTNINL